MILTGFERIRAIFGSKSIASRWGRFKEIKETKGLGTNFRDTIDWAADIISQNKLYAISVDTDKSKSGDGFLDQEIQVCGEKPHALKHLGQTEASRIRTAMSLERKEFRNISSTI